MSVPDPYKVLQVDPEAEAEVIEAAYKRLAKQVPPRRGAGDPEAQARMVQINQAWDMLRDPVRRAAVDRARVRANATTCPRRGRRRQGPRRDRPPPGTGPRRRPAARGATRSRRSRA